MSKARQGTRGHQTRAHPTARCQAFSVPTRSVGTSRKGERVSIEWIERGSGAPAAKKTARYLDRA